MSKGKEVLSGKIMKDLVLTGSFRYNHNTYGYTVNVLKDTTIYEYNGKKGFTKKVYPVALS